MKLLERCDDLSDNRYCFVKFYSNAFEEFDYDFQIEDFYKKINTLVTDNINNLDDSIAKKYIWLKKYLEKYK